MGSRRLLKGGMLKGGIVTAALAAMVVGMAGSAGAMTGAEAADPAVYPFLARVQIADQAACSATLITPQWVLTAQSCFGAPGSVQAGPAPAGTTVTVGRLDLSTTAGYVFGAAQVVPHPDRDLVLVRLAGRAIGVPPVRLGSTAPAAADPLRVAGFGRTADTWVPDVAHVASFGVDAVSASTIDITGQNPDQTLCKGDAGGPVLTSGATPQLVAVSTVSGQAGCLGSAGTDRGARAARVDDLGGWIGANTPAVCRNAGYSTSTNQQPTIVQLTDPSGDCKADISGQAASGDVTTYLSSGDLSADGLIFNGPTNVSRKGWTTAAFQRTISGDFDGDGKADIGAQLANGQLWVYLSTGDNSSPEKLYGGPSAQVGSGWTVSNVQRILTGDFDGDGKTDIAAQYATDGKLMVYLSRGTLGPEPMFTKSSQLVGTGWQAGNVERILVGDMNGDGRDDLLAQYATGDHALRVYPSTGNISGTDTLFKTATTQIGSGWHSANVSRIVLGDFNGDGVTDTGAQYSTGLFQVFLRAKKLGDPDLGVQVVGTNYGPTAIPRIFVGDVNGDGRADIISQLTDGQLRITPSSGELSTDHSLFKGPTRNFGSGWTTSAVPRVF